MDNCTLCETIEKMEKELDVRAEALTNKVKAAIRPVIEHNNKRWENFASLCRIPLIGDGIFYIFNSPKLKDHLAYWDESWYKALGQSIESEASNIEKLKQEDIVHWGNELVNPYLGDDPSAYYFPLHKLRRKDCLDTAYVQFMKDKCERNEDGIVTRYKNETHIQDFEEHLNGLDKEFDQYKIKLWKFDEKITNTEKYDIMLPDKYAFIQGGSRANIFAESRVMDCATKKIEPMCNCNFSAINNKKFFSVTDISFVGT